MKEKKSREERKPALLDDPRYQELQAEHRLLDEKIERLNQKQYLTPEEELEKKQWQKLKLKLKDEMAEIERCYRKERSSEPD